MKVKNFIVWLQDGSHIIGSTDEDWNSLPDKICAIKLVYNELDEVSQVPLARVLNGDDYYFRAPGQNDYIYGMTNVESQLESYEGAVVKKGVWTDDHTYHQILQETFSILGE